MSRESKKFPLRIPQRLRRMTGRVFLFIAGIAFACAALETYLRLQWPFLNSEYLSHFHPKAGIIRQPHSQIRWTNPYSEFFIVEKVNSLGFLDRDPLSPEQRGTGCHITIIGDSFVEARQVAITNKFHVRLEQLAAKELPDLNITTSAFGIGNTGQINQLRYWEEFAQHLNPCVLVLVFVVNDFVNNHPVLQALDSRGLNPDHNPFPTAARNEDGTFELRKPDRKFRERRLPRLPMSWIRRARIYSSQRSYLAKWLHSKLLLWEYTHPNPGGDPDINFWVDHLSQSPRYATLAEEWPAAIQTGPGLLYSVTSIYNVFRKEELPPIFEEALEFTGFALDQFQERADRAGVSLVILSTMSMGTHGERHFDRMHALAEERGIPVIDQAAYIRRQDADFEDARFPHDGHWNLAGHQWAAEALLEYFKANPHICRTQHGELE